MKHVALAGLALLAAASLTLAAPNPDTTWLDPQRAAAEDPDFLVQGEYGPPGPGADWGLQVIAMGGGAFEAYLLEGGLPGAGWDRSKARTKLAGKTEEGVTRLACEKGIAKVEIKDGRAVVTGDGKGFVDLSRIERKSATLGARPPAGALVLFDGTRADAWEGGKIRDGILMCGTTSKQSFQNFSLHLEFVNTYKPYARGQARSNSGVYYQSRYETQVLDSFGLEGRDNECGGIYSIAQPRLNMCLPPLTWQTYDVDFTAAVYEDGKKAKDALITVKLNGVRIHENQRLDHATTASPWREGPEPGPLHLQAHGNQVMYRNIWLVVK
jgi:hypothetical protein